MPSPVLTLTQTAQDDLLQAWLYIAKQDQQAADGVLDAIHREARTADGHGASRTGYWRA